MLNPFKDFLTPKFVLGLEISDTCIGAVRIVNSIKGLEIDRIAFREVRNANEMSRELEQLFREEDGLAQERVFLAYRRMFEYGTRLTMRQFTAHLAYMLTASLEHSDIISLAASAEKPFLLDYRFYNRFFGDNGRGGDNAADQIPVIQAVRSQGFGERPCPAPGV